MDTVQNHIYSNCHSPSSEPIECIFSIPHNNNKSILKDYDDLCNTQNRWVLGLCPQSGTIKIPENTPFRKLNMFRPQIRGKRHIHLRRANLSHWTFISPRNRVAQSYPRTLGSIFVACYDSQGYGGGIRTRLHKG
jgi:hypothetical protein